MEQSRATEDRSQCSPGMQGSAGGRVHGSRTPKAKCFGGALPYTGVQRGWRTLTPPGNWQLDSRQEHPSPGPAPAGLAGSWTFLEWGAPPRVPGDSGSLEEGQGERGRRKGEAQERKKGERRERAQLRAQGGGHILRNNRTWDLGSPRPPLQPSSSRPTLLTAGPPPLPMPVTTHTGTRPPSAREPCPPETEEQASRQHRAFQNQARGPWPPSRRSVCSETAVDQRQLGPASETRRTRGRRTFQPPSSLRTCTHMRPSVGGSERAEGHGGGSSGWATVLPQARQ